VHRARLQGFKITDKERLSLYAVDTTALMARVVQAYAQQLFCDGFFNADPHAGNLFVSVQGGVCRPVLLDFGMTVTLDAKTRLGYCALVQAIGARPCHSDPTPLASQRAPWRRAGQLNMSGVAEAIKGVGYQNSESSRHPDRDFDFFQFLLRDTGSRAAQRKEGKQFFEKRVSQRKADQAAHRAAKDAAKAAEAAGADAKEEAEQAMGRFTQGSVALSLCTTAHPLHAKFANNIIFGTSIPEATVRPDPRFMAEVPESLIFFFRVLGLIRGLCTTLDVALPYLPLMAGYARASLLSRFPAELHATAALSAAPAAAAGALQQRVAAAAAALCQGGHALGLQVGRASPHSREWGLAP
jgi:hypothetical protein